MNEPTGAAEYSEPTRTDSRLSSSSQAVVITMATATDISDRMLSQGDVMPKRHEPTLSDGHLSQAVVI
jgi:hypothetical protein